MAPKGKAKTKGKAKAKPKPQEPLPELESAPPARSSLLADDDAGLNELAEPPRVISHFEEDSSDDDDDMSLTMAPRISPRLSQPGVHDGSTLSGSQPGESQMPPVANADEDRAPPVADPVATNQPGFYQRRNSVREPDDPGRPIHPRFQQPNTPKTTLDRPGTTLDTSEEESIEPFANISDIVPHMDSPNRKPVDNLPPAGGEAADPLSARKDGEKALLAEQPVAPTVKELLLATEPPSAAAAATLGQALITSIRADDPNNGAETPGMPTRESLLSGNDPGPAVVGQALVGLRNAVQASLPEGATAASNDSSAAAVEKLVMELLRDEPEAEAETGVAGEDAATDNPGTAALRRKMRELLRAQETPAPNDSVPNASAAATLGQAFMTSIRADVPDNPSAAAFGTPAQESLLSGESAARAADVGHALMALRQKVQQSLPEGGVAAFHKSPAAALDTDAASSAALGKHIQELLLAKETAAPNDADAATLGRALVKSICVDDPMSNGSSALNSADAAAVGHALEDLRHAVQESLPERGSAAKNDSGAQALGKVIRELVNNPSFAAGEIALGTKTAAQDDAAAKTLGKTLVEALYEDDPSNPGTAAQESHLGHALLALRDVIKKSLPEGGIDALKGDSKNPGAVAEGPETAALGMKIQELLLAKDTTARNGAAAAGQALIKSIRADDPSNSETAAFGMLAKGSSALDNADAAAVGRALMDLRDAVQESLPAGGSAVSTNSGWGAEAVGKLLSGLLRKGDPNKPGIAAERMAGTESSVQELIGAMEIADPNGEAAVTLGQALITSICADAAAGESSTPEKKLRAAAVGHALKALRETVQGSLHEEGMAAPNNSGPAAVGKLAAPTHPDTSVLGEDIRGILLERETPNVTAAATLGQALITSILADDPNKLDASPPKMPTLKSLLAGDDPGPAAVGHALIELRNAVQASLPEGSAAASNDSSAAAVEKLVMELLWAGDPINPGAADEAEAVFFPENDPSHNPDTAALRKNIRELLLAQEAAVPNDSVPTGSAAATLGRALITSIRTDDPFGMPAQESGESGALAAGVGRALLALRKKVLQSLPEGSTAAFNRSRAAALRKPVPDSLWAGHFNNPGAKAERNADILLAQNPNNPAAKGLGQTPESLTPRIAAGGVEPASNKYHHDQIRAVSPVHAPGKAGTVAVGRNIQKLLCGKETAAPNDAAAATLGQALLTSFCVDNPNTPDVAAFGRPAQESLPSKKSSALNNADAAAVGHALLDLRNAIQESLPQGDSAASNDSGAEAVGQVIQELLWAGDQTAAQDDAAAKSLGKALVEALHKDEPNNPGATAASRNLAQESPLSEEHVGHALLALRNAVQKSIPDGVAGAEGMGQSTSISKPEATNGVESLKQAVMESLHAGSIAGAEDHFRKLSAEASHVLFTQLAADFISQRQAVEALETKCLGHVEELARSRAQSAELSERLMEERKLRMREDHDCEHVVKKQLSERENKLEATLIDGQRQVDMQIRKYETQLAERERRFQFQLREHEQQMEAQVHAIEEQWRCHVERLYREVERIRGIPTGGHSWGSEMAARLEPRLGPPMDALPAFPSLEVPRRVPGVPEANYPGVNLGRDLVPDKNVSRILQDRQGGSPPVPLPETPRPLSGRSSTGLLSSPASRTCLGGGSSSSSGLPVPTALPSALHVPNPSLLEGSVPRPPTPQEMRNAAEVHAQRVESVHRLASEASKLINVNVHRLKFDVGDDPARQIRHLEDYLETLVGNVGNLLGGLGALVSTVFSELDVLTRIVTSHCHVMQTWSHAELQEQRTKNGSRLLQRIK